MVSFKTSSIWITTEYLCRVVSNILVTLVVASIIGPVKFGELSVFLLILSLQIGFFKFGLDTVLIEKLSEFGDRKKQLISDTYVAHLSVSFLLGICFYLGHCFLVDTKNWELWVLVSLNMMFHSWQVFEFKNQAEFTSKLTSIIKIVSCLTSASAKLYCALNDSEVYFIFACYVFEYFFNSVVICLVNRSNIVPSSFSFSLCSRMISLIKHALPLWGASILSLLLSKLDMIFASKFLYGSDLGTYSLVSKVFEGWVMVMSIFSVIIFPMIMSKKNQIGYEDFIVRIYRIIIFCSLGIYLVVVLTSQWMFDALFDAGYESAPSYVMIIMLGAVFSGLSSMNSRYLASESGGTEMFTRTVCLVFISPLIFYILYNEYGAYGIAIGLTINMFLSAVVLNCLSRNGKKIIGFYARAMYLKRI